MKAKALWYNGQKAVICAEGLATLTSKKWGTNGSIALAYELGDGDKPEDGCYHLIWEWGGDWTQFDENFFANLLDPDTAKGSNDVEAVYEAQKEEAKMYQQAIYAAFEKARELCPDCEEDLEWYQDLTQYDEEMYAEEWAALVA